MFWAYEQKSQLIFSWRLDEEWGDLQLNKTTHFEKGWFVVEVKQTSNRIFWVKTDYLDQLFKKRQLFWATKWLFLFHL